MQIGGNNYQGGRGWGAMRLGRKSGFGKTVRMWEQWVVTLRNERKVQNGKRGRDHPEAGMPYIRSNFMHGWRKSGEVGCMIE